MAEERAQRRLAAILAADVVGYSRLVERDEASTLAALKSRRKEVLEPLVTRHQGRIFKLTGDGVLIEFASAVNAVECAVELQSQMGKANASLPEDQAIVLRVGINLGDVVVEGADLFGDGVIVASRLEALAEPGSVYVSQSVFNHVEGKIACGFQELGEQALKNLAKPIRIYRVAGQSAAKAASDHRPGTKPSIAVLPFTNMSGDPEQQYFSDGITEDIITELSRARGLFVIARNSSFSYRDKAVDVRRIAHDLSVRYVVEGSVRRMADRIRITAQLIDAVSGHHLWSEHFDRNIDDLFAIQDELTQTIVTTMTGRLEDAEIGNASRKRTDSLSAYDCLLRGVEQLRAYGPDVNRRARELFEQAISLDPRYALAHAYLALSLVIENGYGNASDAIKQRALESAVTAVRLDPRESRCQIFLGQVHRFRNEYDLAISHLERGLALNPNDAAGMRHLAFVLGVCGRAEEGVEILHRAIKLDPYLHFYWGALATCLYALRRYEEALAAYRKLGSDKSPWQLAKEAACLAQLGRIDEAHAVAAEVLRRKPSFSLRAEMPHYKHPADAENLHQGLLMAGLPE